MTESLPQCHAHTLLIEWGKDGRVFHRGSWQILRLPNNEMHRMHRQRQRSDVTFSFH